MKILKSLKFLISKFIYRKCFSVYRLQRLTSKKNKELAARRDDRYLELLCRIELAAKRGSDIYIHHEKLSPSYKNKLRKLGLVVFDDGDKVSWEKSKEIINDNAKFDEL